MKLVFPVAVGLLLTVHTLSASQIQGPDLLSATLEELMNMRVTTATRTPESLKDVPARMHIVTAEEIRRRGYRSLADVLKDVPDVKVDLAGDPDFPTELVVQGTRGASRVVVLLDGIRISAPTNEPLPILANYPVHNARQIEILFGPASAMYGADAFSAVINIISKDATDASGLQVESAVGQDGLYNESASYGARFGRGGSVRLSGQFLYDRQPDLSRIYPGDFRGLQAQSTGVFNTIFGPMTSTRPVSPEYDIPLSAHSFQAAYRIGGLQLSLFENRSRVSTAPAYTPDNAVYNSSAFNKNTLRVLSGSYARKIGAVTSTSTVTDSRHELDPESGYWNVFSNLTRSYKYAYGSLDKFDEELAWKPAAATTITTGGTFERFFSIPKGADLNAPLASQETPGTILGTNIPDDLFKLHYNNVGGYAQLQYAPVSRVTLTLGARGDHNTRYGNTFNPRVGVVVRPVASTTLKLLYGTAFLAPSPFEAYQHFGSFISVDGGATYTSGYWHVPNPDLRPQKKQTVEMSLMQSLGDLVAVSASAFYSRFTDLLKLSEADKAQAGLYHGWPVSYLETGVNAGNAEMYGGTAGIDAVRVFSFDRRVALHAAVSIADGRIREDSNDGSASLPIGAMVPLQFKSGADADWGGWGIAPRVTVEGRQRFLATVLSNGSVVRRTLPGYAVVDVNVRRRNVTRHADLFLTVENALGARYRNINTRALTNPDQLIGAPQNPRRLTVGVDLQLWGR